MEGATILAYIGYDFPLLIGSKSDFYVSETELPGYFIADQGFFVVVELLCGNRHFNFVRNFWIYLMPFGFQATSLVKKIVIYTDYLTSCNFARDSQRHAGYITMYTKCNQGLDLLHEQKCELKTCKYLLKL